MRIQVTNNPFLNLDEKTILELDAASAACDLIRIDREIRANDYDPELIEQRLEILAEWKEANYRLACYNEPLVVLIRSIEEENDK